MTADPPGAGGDLDDASASPWSRSLRLARLRRRSLERGLVVLLLIAPLAGLIGVVAGEAVPDGRIANHLLRAVDARVTGPTQYSTTVVGTKADHFSECILLTVGLGDPPGEDHVSTALLNPTYIACEDMHAELQAFATTGTLESGVSYLRYWHGYSVITRPAIGVLGLAGARSVVFTVLAVVAGAVTLAVRRSFGAVAAILLVGPALLTTDMVVGGYTLGQAIGIATAWAGAWLAFAVVRRRPTWQVAALSGALGGVVNAYFDLMTTIPGALAFSALGATLGAVAARRDDLRGLWKITAGAAVGWGGGMIWMWGSKWVVAAVALGPDAVVDNVKGQIEFRLSGAHQGVSDSRIRGLTANLSMWWDQPLTPWVIGATSVVVATAVVRHGARRIVLGRAVACGAVAVAPLVVWYLALNNHSQIHAYLVYRSVAIAFGGLAALAFVAAASPLAGSDVDSEPMETSASGTLDDPLVPAFTGSP